MLLAKLRLSPEESLNNEPQSGIRYQVSGLGVVIILETAEAESINLINATGMSSRPSWLLHLSINQFSTRHHKWLSL